MSAATHCIPWDSDCSICNPPTLINPDDAPAPSPLLVDPRLTEIEEAVIAYGAACVNDERIVAGSLETRAAARARVLSLVDGLAEDARRLDELNPLNVDIVRVSVEGCPWGWRVGHRNAPTPVFRTIREAIDAALRPSGATPTEESNDDGDYTHPL